MRKTKVICVAVTFLLFLQGSATAEWEGVEKCYWLYGHVYNTDDGTATGNPVPWCAPTATINSFRYLEQRYPTYYDNLLTGGDIVGARNLLKDMMNAEDGASAQDMWEGKVTYLETFAPGVTKYSGMVFGEDPSTWSYGEYLTAGFPTWEFLFTELGACEDVEIGIYGYELGHALTLTSLTFDDTNGNHEWDTGEARKIDYIDPNNPTQVFWADLWVDVDGSLNFTWNNGGANPPASVWIGLAYSESVPEPATLSLLALGCLAVLRRRKK